MFDEVCIFVFINDIEITLCSVLKGSHSSESVGLWTQLFAGGWKPTNGKGSLPKNGMEKTYFMFPTSESGGVNLLVLGAPFLRCAEPPSPIFVQHQTRWAAEGEGLRGDHGRLLFLVFFWLSNPIRLEGVRHQMRFGCKHCTLTT